MTKKLEPIHPGEILLEDFMEPLGLSQNQLARELSVPVTRIGEIVNGRRSITAETAMRLGRYFNQSPEFWLGLQQQYDLELAQDEAEVMVRKEVTPRPLVTVR